MEATDRQGQGKIHRLPFERRMELHARLLDGVPQVETLAWVNGLAEWPVIRDQLFEGKDITAQNLSDYKLGKDYATWRQRQERLQDLKAISAVASNLAEAGDGMSDGSAAIIGGRIFTRLEKLMAEDGDNEEIDQLVGMLVKLRKGDQKRQDLQMAKLALAQKTKELEQKTRELQLQRDKIETNAAERLLEIARSDEVQGVLNSKQGKNFQIQALRRIMFPQRKEAE